MKNQKMLQINNFILKNDKKLFDFNFGLINFYICFCTKVYQS
jgi:hypothetical protein